MGDFLHWCVLETLLVLQGWIPAAFPTPTQAEKWVRKVLCAPSFIERDENVLNENGTSGNFVRSQALKLCILQNSLFLLPRSSFPLEIQVFAVNAGQPCSLRSHIVSYRQLSHSSSAFIWDFCLPFPRTGRCEPSLSGAAPGTTCLMDPRAVSSLARFFNISLNLHLNVGRSDPIPTLKSCCDASATWL